MTSRPLRRITLAIGLLMTSVVMAQTQAQDLDPALTGKMWRVMEIDGSPAAFDETFEITALRIAGKASCNRFSGPIKMIGPDLAIGPLAATRMFCDGRMEAEARLLTALQAVRRASVAGDAATLEGGDGRSLLKLVRRP